MTSDERARPDGWIAVGTPDPPTVTPDWLAIDPPAIEGVLIKEIRSVATSNGYLTEIFRSSYASIGKGQSEGAAALGLHRGQIFFLIVLPQALRVALPSLVNEFISLLKATSLATVISLKELMTVTQFAIATSFRFLEWYGAALIYYMSMVSVLTVFQMKIERMLARGHR